MRNIPINISHPFFDVYVRKSKYICYKVIEKISDKKYVRLLLRRLQL